jgi:hypothetical protein
LITKKILHEYIDLQREIEETREKIAKVEKQIAKIEKQGAVIDTVSGGDGGIQHFKIEGFPYPEYSRKKTLLYARQTTLTNLEIELMETINEIELFISQIDDSFMRRIINLRFIEKLSWGEVANRMGGANNEDNIKKAFYRFMEK